MPISCHELLCNSEVMMQQGCSFATDTPNYNHDVIFQKTKYKVDSRMTASAIVDSTE